MSRIGRWGGILLVLMLVACSGPGSAVRRGISEGDQAPNFTLKTLDGKKASLKDYRGSVVLINLWATWCAPCEAEIPDLEAVYQERQADGFVILGINMQESHDVVASFVTARDVTYPILLDEAGRVAETYRAVGLPMSVLVDREGIIQVRHRGLLTAMQLENYLANLLP